MLKISQNITQQPDSAFNTSVNPRKTISRNNKLLHNIIYSIYPKENKISLDLFEWSLKTIFMVNDVYHLEHFHDKEKHSNWYTILYMQPYYICIYIILWIGNFQHFLEWQPFQKSNLTCDMPSSEPINNNTWCVNNLVHRCRHSIISFLKTETVQYSKIGCGNVKSVFSSSKLSLLLTQLNHFSKCIFLSKWN